MDPEEGNQRREEDQRAHQSGVDRANDLINKARQLRNYKKGLQGAQKSLQAARAGATAIQAAATAQGGVAAGTGAAATSPAWGTAIAIILLIILIIALFIIVFAGGQNVNAGTPPACTSITGGVCGTTCQSPNILDTSGASCSASLTGETQVCCIPPSPPVDNTTCTIGNAATVLKNEFNVVVSNATASHIKIVCDIFSWAGKSPQYKTLLKKGGHVLTIEFIGGDISYGGDPNKIKLAGFWSIDSFYAQRYLLIHESGHIIRLRNPYLNSRHASALPGLISADRSCYDRYNFLISYAFSGTCGRGYGITYQSEDFAEATSDNANWRTHIGHNGYCSRTISNYPTTCSYTFDWVKRWVYGGITF